MKAHYKKHKLESYDSYVHMSILNSKKVKVRVFSVFFIHLVVVRFVQSLREGDARRTELRVRAHSLLSAAEGVYERPGATSNDHQ